jgi:hypothetical protein
MMTLDLYGHLIPDELHALSSALDGLRTRTPADSVRTPGDQGDLVNRRHIASYLGKRWWGGQDLNLRPTDYESAALTD